MMTLRTEFSTDVTLPAFIKYYTMYSQLICYFSKYSALKIY